MSTPNTNETTSPKTTTQVRPKVKTPTKTKKKGPHYVDNKALYAAMTTYKLAVIAAKENGTEKPRVSEYIGECIYKIATHLSTAGNFCNYPFREELVGDAIDNCLNYIDNFDHVKYQNPFAYFTQISWFAFIRRIQREKKQLYIKQKTYQNARLMGMVNNYQEGDEDSGNINADYGSEYMDDLVKNFEEKLKVKKSKKVKTPND